MATWLERNDMMFEAAFNRKPTNAERATMAEVLYGMSPAEYAALTDAQKVQIGPRKLRQWFIRERIGYAGNTAAESARLTAVEQAEQAWPDSDLP